MFSHEAAHIPVNNCHSISSGTVMSDVKRVESRSAGTQEAVPPSDNNMRGMERSLSFNNW